MISTGSITLNMELGGGIQEGEIVGLFYRQDGAAEIFIWNMVKRVCETDGVLYLTTAKFSSSQLEGWGKIDESKLWVGEIRSMDQVRTTIKELALEVTAAVKLVVIDTITDLDPGNTEEYPGLIRLVEDLYLWGNKQMAFLVCHLRSRNPRPPRDAFRYHRSLLIEEEEGAHHGLHIDVFTKRMGIPTAQLFVPFTGIQIDHVKEVMQGTGMCARSARNAIDLGLLPL